MTDDYLSKCLSVIFKVVSISCVGFYLARFGLFIRNVHVCFAIHHIKKVK